MAYRPHGRASVDSNNPAAFGRCDRCGFIYNQRSLRFQFDYRGPQLQNLRFLVCAPCYDKPQAQLKPIILSADPMPIINARPENYNYANTGNLAVTGSTTDPDTGIPVYADIDITTENGINITSQPLGPPANLSPNAIMPLFNTTAYNVLVPVLSITANNTTTITVTCSSAHNLTNNDQISVAGITEPKASGFFNATVVSATVFTYEAPNPITSGGLLDTNSRIVTALVGIPPQYTQIPQVGA